MKWLDRAEKLVEQNVVSIPTASRKAITIGVDPANTQGGNRNEQARICFP